MDLWALIQGPFQEVHGVGTDHRLARHTQSLLEVARALSKVPVSMILVLEGALRFTLALDSIRISHRILDPPSA